MPNLRRSRRLLVTVAAVVGLLGVPTVVAAAVGGGGGSSPPAPLPVQADGAQGESSTTAHDGITDDTAPASTTEAEDAGTETLGTDVPGDAAPTADGTAADAPAPTEGRAVEPAPTATEVRPEEKPDREPPHIRFKCGLERTDRGPVVACVWEPGPADRVAGYRLWRAVDDQAREVIFETRDLRRHGHADRNVEPGHLYHYAVQFIGFEGEVLATSHAERIRIPAPEPAVIRLACESVAHDGPGGVVACKWSQPDVRVAGYKLVRRDADGREVVARVGPDVHAHRERVRPGRYQYRVYGIGRDGGIVAVSPAVSVFVPPDRPDPAVTDRPVAAG